MRSAKMLQICLPNDCEVAEWQRADCKGQAAAGNCESANASCWVITSMRLLFSSGRSLVTCMTAASRLHAHMNVLIPSFILILPLYLLHIWLRLVSCLQVIKSAVRRMDLGGKALTNYLTELVSYRSVSLPQSSFPAFRCAVLISKEQDNLCSIHMIQLCGHWQEHGHA